MDVVVTIPKGIWYDWLEEGDLPGEPWDGEMEYHWFSGGWPPPAIEPGERVYIVAHSRLRGYAPLVRVDVLTDVVDTFKPRTFTTAIYSRHDARLLHKPVPDWWWPRARYGLVRHGGAVACTIPEPIRGFQGWRERWWRREDEIAFPYWQTEGVA